MLITESTKKQTPKIIIEQRKSFNNNSIEIKQNKIKTHIYLY